MRLLEPGCVSPVWTEGPVPSACSASGGKEGPLHLEGGPG